MANLQKDFPLIKFVLHENTDNIVEQPILNPQSQAGIEIKNVNCLDECAICMEKMVTGRKLACGHIFHQFCIINLIQSANKKCPMCRTVIRSSTTSSRWNENQAPNNNRGRQNQNVNGRGLGRDWENQGWFTRMYNYFISFFPRFQFTFRYISSDRV